MPPLTDLPGEEFIREGLADLQQSRVTISACLAALGRTTLERAGFTVPDLGGSPGEDIEPVLYRLLKAEGGDAYSRYNSLLRRLASFEHALQHRTRPAPAHALRMRQV